MALDNIEKMLDIQFIKEESVAIDYIKEDNRFYPREHYDESAINRYRLNIDALPAIQISESGILLDGKHRLIAHRIEQRKEILSKIYRLPEKSIRAYAAYLNSQHGLQLSQREKKAEAERLLRENHFSDEIIGKLLGLSRRTVSDWLGGVKQEVKSIQQETVWNLWLKCYTQEQIAEEVSQMGYGEVARETIRDWINAGEKGNSAEIAKPSDLKLYTIWNFPKLAEDQLKYPGQLPEALIENILYYWSEPGQIIWDPFAGSGVTGKVAEKMVRRYQLSDLAPIDPSLIRQHDLLDGIPDWLMRPDLIFLDPPYWNQVGEKYTDHKSNIGRMGLEEFYKAFEKMLICFNKFKGVKIAIIIQDTQWRNNHQTESHVFKIWQMAETLGWRFLERVIVPYANSQYTPQQQDIAKKERIPLVLHRDLIIFEVPNVR